jgi:hypothetical protein
LKILQEIFNQKKLQITNAHNYINGLVRQNFMVGQIPEKKFKKEGDTYTMHGRRCLKPSCSN